MTISEEHPVAHPEGKTHRLFTPASVTWLGFAVNLALAIAKVLAGVWFNSQTILADGLHSSSDLVTDIAVLAGVRVSNKPADRTHHYGHRRVATLVAMFVGIGLFVAAGLIAYNAVTSMRGETPQVRGLVPLILAMVSIPAKEVLFRLTRWVGKRYKDMSLVANAWHHRSDAFSSIAAAVGLSAVALGGSDMAILDPVTAMVLMVFLAIAAYRIVRQSADELVDRAPSKGTMKTLESAIAKTQGVRDYHAFRARKIGGKIIMDIHVLVDPDLSVRQGHDIATDVRDRVMKTAPSVAEAIVHIEPADNTENGD